MSVDKVRLKKIAASTDCFKSYPQAHENIQAFISRGHHGSIDYMLLADIERGENKFAEAAESYRLAIQTQGSFQSRIFNSMIECLVAAKQTDKAISELSKQLAVNNEDCQLFDKRGELFQSQKKYSLALSDYTKAISIEPAALYLKHRAALYDLTGQNALAKADREKAKLRDKSTELF